MQRPIYFDYMATTPVDERVIEKMQACLGSTGVFGNPASVTHAYGYAAKELVDRARAQVAAAIGADSREIIWTSGATEANNLAIQGVAHFYQRQGRHIITMATEHKSVLDPCHYLESQGFQVTYLKPEHSGLLNLDSLKQAITSETLLISIMHVNNETGVIQDLAAIGKIAQQHGIKFHIDAVQSIGKTHFDINEFHADLASFSGHKVYAPKGIGALYVRRTPRVRLQPILFGGGHEQGLRSGTLATHQIVALGEAFELANKNLSGDLQKITQLSNKLWNHLKKIDGIHLNAATEQRVPHCLNIRFDGVDGEALLLSLRDIAVSMGSACNSARPEPSAVLTAMGYNRNQAHSSLRVSLGKYTSEEDIDYAILHITQQLKKLRDMSPVWEKIKNRIAKSSE